MLLVPLRSERSTRRWVTPLVALALALAFHLAVVGLVALASLLSPPRPPPPRAVTLRPISAERWAANRDVSGAQRQSPTAQAKAQTPRADAPEKPKKPPEAMPEGQIVDVAPGNGEVDDQARFIAETSNKAARQTRAKEQTPFYRNAMPQRTAPQRVEGNGTDVAARAQRSGNDGLGDDDRPLKQGATPRLAIEVPDVKPQQEVALEQPRVDGPGVAVANRTEREAVRGNSSRLRLVPGTPGDGEEGSAGRAGQAGALNLLPSPAVVDRIVGAAPNDSLRDVDEGDGTFLSTREWKYASFFNRVKQSVGQQWNPSQQLRLRDPSGNIYGGRDRYTLLSITLDEKGRLKDAWVEKSSGLDFLDLEAMKAFERAQPFPNPPSGILAADATVRFQFGFFLEMSGRPGMRLFRSAP